MNDAGADDVVKLFSITYFINTLLLQGEICDAELRGVRSAGLERLHGQIRPDHTRSGKTQRRENCLVRAASGHPDPRISRYGRKIPATESLIQHNGLKIR